MLKALELVGFKSFADKTRFDFPPGITAVVGPNGSGKSNVVDAIKWVLGEQSVKSLRGKEMADVIFNGSASRAPLNFAETTLTLDNSTRRLPIDASEVLVTRRVYRNGEGEYMLNRQPCRLRDIRELFSGTGVATEAYSVIEQGKVDVMLQSSARDRRLIFEEAAGISRFKAKKIESLRRLERVEQNLLRLGDIVAEVEHRLRQVRLQAAKARRYKEYSDRLQQLRTHVGMTDWRTWSARIAEMESELAALTAERDEASRAAGQRDTSAAGEETNVATTSEAIRTSEARGANSRRNRHAGSRADHHRLRAAELEKEADRLRRQLTAVNVRAGSLAQQLQDAAAQVATADSEYKRISTVTTAEDARLAEVSARLTAIRRDAEHARRGAARRNAPRAQWESETSSLTARLESARRPASAIRAETRRRHHRPRYARCRAGRPGHARNEPFDRDRRTIARGCHGPRTIGTACRTSAPDFRATSPIAERLTAARERAAVLEEFQRRREGYNEAVKEVLALADETSGPYQHVRGVVAELLQVNLEMAPLIEVALGEPASTSS